jgi:hypothetical protein
MNKREIEYNSNFSSYEGSPYISGYEGSNPYIGYKDHLLHFVGGSLDSADATFVSEYQQKISFTMSVTTSAATAQPVLNMYICAGVDGAFTDMSVPNTLGLIRDGAFQPIDPATGLPIAVDGNNPVGAGSPTTIKRFINYIRMNPTRWTAMKVKSTTATQIDQSMTVGYQSPFRTLESKVIPLAAHSSEMAFQNNVVTVPLTDYNLQFDNQTTILIPIVCNSAAQTHTFTLFFGVALNTAAALSTKAKEAYSNIAQAAANYGGRGNANFKGVRPAYNVDVNRVLLK